MEEEAKSQEMKAAFRSWERRLGIWLSWSSIYNHEDLGLDCQHLCKTLDMAVHACNPSMEGAEKGGLLGLGDEAV